MSGKDDSYTIWAATTAVLGVCLILFGIVRCSYALADDSLSLHGYAIHYERGDKYTPSYNAAVYGLGYNARYGGTGYHVGGYYNSYRHVSAYAGTSYEECSLTLCGGVVAFIATGYPQGDIMPMLGATAGYKLSPKWRINAAFTPVVTELSLEIKL